MTLIPFNEFTKLFADAGVATNSREYELFAKYAAFLAEKNAVMNLTAITQPQEVAEKHFLDSVLPLKFFRIPDGARVADVGSGAGFPGVPWAIVRPDIRLCALDSLNKRVNFLRELCQILEIKAECIHTRAEDAGRGELRESFDVAAARAVGRLSLLCGYCLPLVKVGGAFLALKGGDPSEELKAAESEIKALGGETEDVFGYALPNSDARTLVVVRKVRPTPPGLPKRGKKVEGRG